MEAQIQECAIPGTADVVVVGAGAAGAVVAARLAALGGADVLLVEAGPDYRTADTPAAVRGADIGRALAVRSLRWPELPARVTAAQPDRPYVQGRGAGGGSAINGQLAVRGTPADRHPWPWPAVRSTFVALEDDLDLGDRPGHGRGGPVPISRTAADRRGPVSAALHAAAIGHGHPEHPDVNAEGSTGVSAAARHRRDGVRVSSNDSYLEPARGNPCLRVAGEHTAVRVLVAGGRVRGVELAAHGAVEVVPAPAVVLCAGAVHSPALLLRSGVGPAADLADGVVVDLPGVGAGLSDHPAVLLDLRLTEAAAARARGTESGGVLLRTGDLQVFPMDRTFGTAGGLLVSLMRPVSRGSVRVRGGEPVVDLGMLDSPADRDRLGAGVRHAVSLLADPAFGAITDEGPELPPGDLGGWLRERCRPQYHPSGTCATGRVVDEEGRVNGVDGLWVADASVLPEPCGAPPYLTTVMVAERLAAAIGRRLSGGR